MRLRIYVDNVSHEIDSIDPELIGRWMVEILNRATVAGITPATQIMVQANPSWVPRADGEGRPDWIADSYFLDLISNVKTPREIVDALGEVVGRYEEKHDV